MSDTSGHAESFRDERGRFLPGNSGGPGRPPRAIERDYLSIAGDVITPEDWRSLVEIRSSCFARGYEIGDFAGYDSSLVLQKGGSKRDGVSDTKAPVPSYLIRDFQMTWSSPFSAR